MALTVVAKNIFKGNKYVITIHGIKNNIFTTNLTNFFIRSIQYIHAIYQNVGKVFVLWDKEKITNKFSAIYCFARI